MATSAPARYDPNPAFFKPTLLASSDISHPVINPASVSIETARHIAPASTNRAAAQTSGLLAPQLDPAQIQPALETRYFLTPNPAGSDPIANLTEIKGTAMSYDPDIDTFIKGCQFQTIAAPPTSSYHQETPLIQSLETLGFPAAAGKPWSLDPIRDAIKRGPQTSTHNPASTFFCLEELAYCVSRGFSILLTAEMAILLFGRGLRISFLAGVPQTNQKDRIICDSTAPPPGGDSLLIPSS